VTQRCRCLERPDGRVAWVAARCPSKARTTESLKEVDAVELAYCGNVMGAQAERGESCCG
jgi:hypothetical protein